MNDNSNKDGIFKNNFITDNLAKITSVEEFDPMIIDFEKENLEGYLDLLIEQSCNFSKIKGSDTLNKDDILFIHHKLTGLVEPIGDSMKNVYKSIKQEELNKNQTQEHRKRVDLTKEENKLINE